MFGPGVITRPKAIAAKAIICAALGIGPSKLVRTPGREGQLGGFAPVAEERRSGSGRGAILATAAEADRRSGHSAVSWIGSCSSAVWPACGPGLHLVARLGRKQGLDEGRSVRQRPYLADQDLAPLCEPEAAYDLSRPVVGGKEPAVYVF